MAIGVFLVPLHSQFQRFHAAHREPTIERRRHRARRVLQELDRLENRRVFRQRRALNRVRMPGQIFRHAVHHDVRAQLERLLEIRRRESVVHHHQRASRACASLRCRNVVNQQPRIGRRLDPHQPRLRRDRRLHRVQVARIDLPDHHADRLIHLVENPVSPAVNVAAES